MDRQILDELNEAQRQAVMCCDAPSLVIAGAGSGKTRVLTYKIAYLLQQGMEPWAILALTFTNKAAREMRQRIGRLVGEHEAAMLWMGTFHSIFYRILRYEAAVLGFTPNFTIYDTDDQKTLMRRIIREMGLDEKQYRPGVVANRISAAKNELIRPSQYVQRAELVRRDQATRMKMVHEIYRQYQERLRQADAMDFDDLLLYTYILLSEHPDVRRRYEERFQFVLVDEYQDTNYAQHQIVWLLTEHRQRVSVVGDDAQSIYSFRGARLDNILTFQRMYEGSRLFKLEQNYRSTRTIVGAANSVIHHNQRQIHKDVRSMQGEGELVEVCEAYSDKEEAAMVARRIQELVVRGPYQYGQVAILYRTNGQSRAFEEEFLRRRMPYRIYGGMSFYQRREVRDALAYMRLTVNPRDEEALRRVINYPARGIGQTTLDRVGHAALVAGVPMFDVVSRPEAYALEVNQPTQERLRRFAQFISQYNALVPDEPANTLAIRLLRDSGMTAEINAGHEPEDRDRQANLQELMDSISSFVADRQEEGQGLHLTDFLQQVSLMTDQDREPKRTNVALQGPGLGASSSGASAQQGQDDGASSSGASEAPVTLMTVHAAKGLEYPVVFVVGMEENLFPSEMAVDEGNLEEERRLFYVAVTRAAERLFLTWSHSRMRQGRFENNQRSRFLREIEPRYLTTQPKQASSLLFGSAGPKPLPRKPFPESPESPERPAQKPASSPGASRPLRPVSAYTSDYTARAPLPDGQSVEVGSHIEHARFGLGVVTALSGTGLDTKATVEFQNSGTRQLLLRFAKFRVL